jgi:metallophosphoesterase (TIGR00282 family)
VRILFLGDIVGRPARAMLKERLPQIIEAEGLDFVVANGENAAAGSGLTESVANDLFAAGIDVVTLGDHAFKKKDVVPLLTSMDIVRPLNISRRAPGRGYLIKQKNGKKIGVINLQGRVFMGPADCPFNGVMDILDQVLAQTRVVIVDIHAEATSEKVAMGYFLAGKVSVVAGTHTHIPTADARIIAGHTGYITDAGMCGAFDSVLGRKKESIIERFVTNLPVRFDLAEGDVRLQGVLLDVDEISGRTTFIKRVEYAKIDAQS